MKLTLEGLGPDISVEMDHVEPGLRRAKFDLMTENGIHEGARISFDIGDHFPRRYC